VHHLLVPPLKCRVNMSLVIRVMKVRDNAIVEGLEIEASTGRDGEGGVLAESIVKLARDS
jgi:hypothetical protein